MNAELVGSLLQKTDPAMPERACRAGHRMDRARLSAFVLRINKLGLHSEYTRRGWSLGITDGDRPAPDRLTIADHTDASLPEIEMNTGLSLQ